MQSKLSMKERGLSPTNLRPPLSFQFTVMSVGSCVIHDSNISFYVPLVKKKYTIKHIFT